MKEITQDMVIKIRMGANVVDMFDDNGLRLPVEGNAVVVEKKVATQVKGKK